VATKRLDDARAMAKAVAAAHRGLGATYPNPCVGAVVVAGGKLVSSARSRPTGGAHAEPQALAKAGRRAHGATLYVTLEPCCHVGRTPPCTKAIIAAGVARVVVGVRDPAPHAAGRGIAALRRAGIEVDVGVGAEACEAVHAHYLHHERTGTPFVTLKAAISLDGRIATASGDSKWITSERARRHVHRVRAEHHAIMVGAQTVLDDDPGLDVRWVRGVDPVPLVLDTRLQLGGARAPRRRVLRPGTFVLHGPAAAAAARRRVERTGATPVELPVGRDGHLDLAAVLQWAAAGKLRSILVEGGGHVLGSFVREGLWQDWLLYQSPRLLGEGRAVLSGVDWPTVAEAPVVLVNSRRALGPDLLWSLSRRR
jgi:diaminohydroxyphosphoribosylaminopyrimidine deaminase/5-amino-6-(5-phosphoribosylamino)uracil reductase